MIKGAEYGCPGVRPMYPLEQGAFTFLVTQIWVTLSVRIQARNLEPLSPLRLTPIWQVPLYVDKLKACPATQRRSWLPTRAWIWRTKKQSTWELWARAFSKDSFAFDRIINFFKKDFMELVPGVSPSTTKKHTDYVQVLMKKKGLFSENTRFLGLLLQC